MIDDHSRYLIALEATGKLEGTWYRQQLERVLPALRLPEAMLMDHGTPWWNWQSFSGRTHLSLWMMRQGIRAAVVGIRHPQTQGKVERFHGSLQRALDARRQREARPQTWLDAFRSEYNHVRPHEALEMQYSGQRLASEPATLRSPPARWEYPQGAWTLKVDCQGTVDLKGRRWRIGKTLAGERVLIQPIEERYLVYYCATLVRELDPAMQRSTIVERCIEHKNQTTCVKDVPGQCVKHLVGLDIP